LVGLVLWFYDITPYTAKREQLLRENKQLKEENGWFSALLDHLPFPVWRRDAALNLSYANQAYAQLSGESRTPHGEATPLPELTESSRSLASWAKETRALQQERMHIVSGGKRRLFRLSEMPVGAECIGFAIDITDLEKVEREVERHVSAQSDL